ncbi:MAG: peptidoglycan-associated lipoprotein [Desulfobulbus propionicus]|nr:MAG: peptidoglycan-associated lipoprotein [Desulfobulbus propionicus]
MRISSSLILIIISVCLFGFGLAGCGKKPPKAPAAVPADDGAGQVEPLETQESDILEGRTSGPMLPVYFEFDKSDIMGEQVQRIENNATYLMDNKNINIRVEGNCDPRGTNEYNLALGERRAQSAKKYLVNLGISADRITTVSWGEEKLLLFGHDEVSWAQNRRDDFVIAK